MAVAADTMGSRGLEQLIEVYRAAYDAWMATADEVGDIDANSPEGESEDRAMMAVLSYPARNIEEARRKAEFLLASRFRDELDREHMAWVHSFL